ncbi:MAG: redoxin domain-containing protein [Lentimicrobiaceae bacterium]|nr:redoxin domain-containing protein [Lentimicrobiaceae bacterium]
MKKICLFIILIINFLTIEKLSSQNVVINGKVNEPNALIRLFSYNDMLSCEMTKIAETKSDHEGVFKLEATINEIGIAQIAVNLERVDFLLKPNATYDLEILIPEQEIESSYFERQNPTLKMNNADDQGLYYQYYASETIINDFILEHFNQIYRGRQLSLLDTLDVRIEKEVGDIKSDFVRDYVRYRKASIQMAVNNDNAKKVVNQYYDKNEILYSQPAYMELFREIFTDYLLSRQFEPSEFMQMYYSGYDAFLSYLKNKDAFLAENQELTELILSWNLKRMYYEYPDERKITLNYFDVIKERSDNRKNKKIIDDILKQIHRLSFDSEAPEFSLRDRNGNVIKLSDYQDDMLILQFVNHTSHMIDYHFDRLNELSYQWQDSVRIITIATKDSFEDFKQMFDNKSITWSLLDLDDDILLLEEYQIRTFPDYIILRKGGKIGMAPAPAPDQYLDYHVRRIYKYL